MTGKQLVVFWAAIWPVQKNIWELWLDIKTVVVYLILFLGIVVMNFNNELDT
jgi:hypothetical protein